MEARVLKWQELANIRKFSVEEFEKFQLEAREKELEKERLSRVQQEIEMIPLRFRNKKFKDYLTACADQVKIKAICERFFQTFDERCETNTSLMFLGKPGTGKTFLSLILHQNLIQNRFTVKYEPNLQFLKILQEKRFESDAAYQRYLSLYQSFDLLILDEISESLSKNGMPTEFEKKLLFDVINRRYQEKKGCTLIISNRSKKELVKRLGAQIIDRLSENSITLIFNWESYRQK